MVKIRSFSHGAIFIFLLLFLDVLEKL